LANRACSFREFIAAKAVDRVGPFGGIDRILLVASLGCYARCHSELDPVLLLVREFFRNAPAAESFG
jgi:hypothetical protein